MKRNIAKMRYVKMHKKKCLIWKNIKPILIHM